MSSQAVREIEVVTLFEGLVVTDVGLPDGDVVGQPGQESGVVIQGHDVPVGTDPLGEPAGDRPGANADVQAPRSPGDADDLRALDGGGIASSVAVVETLGLQQQPVFCHRVTVVVGHLFSREIAEAY